MITWWPRDSWEERNIFPGIAFQVPEGGGAFYLGTLSVSVPARKDFMGNKWMTGSPSIQVLDEFERDREILRGREAAFSGRIEKRLMLWDRALETQPPYQNFTLWPILNALPWPLLMHR